LSRAYAYVDSLHHGYVDDFSAAQRAEGRWGTEYLRPSLRKRAPLPQAPGTRGGDRHRLIHAAIWLREWKPSLVLMLATCRATVAGLMNSCSAIDRLLIPRPTSWATSRSRGVSTAASASAGAEPVGAAPVSASRSARRTASSTSVRRPSCHHRSKLPSRSGHGSPDAECPEASRIRSAAPASRVASSACPCAAATVATASSPRAVPSRCPVWWHSVRLSRRQP